MDAAQKVTASELNGKSFLQLSCICWICLISCTNIFEELYFKNSTVEPSTCVHVHATRWSISIRVSFSVPHLHNLKVRVEQRSSAGRGSLPLNLCIAGSSSSMKHISISLYPYTGQATILYYSHLFIEVRTPANRNPPKTASTNSSPTSSQTSATSSASHPLPEAPPKNSSPTKPSRLRSRPWH